MMLFGTKKILCPILEVHVLRMHMKHCYGAQHQEKQSTRSTIWTWLRKANSLRRYGKQNQESINGLIQSLGLDGLDSESHFDPKNDDIADWFSGSPDWVRRS